MARVAFIQFTMIDNLGPMILCAELKKHGHDTEIIIAPEEPNYAQRLRDKPPDIFAFSCTTGTHLIALREIESLRSEFPDSMMLMGGPHPTYFPEIVNEDGLDVICRGDGEEAMVELADAVQDGSDFSGIENLWVKRDGEVTKNALRPLNQDLDGIAFPDREFYHRYKSVRIYPSKLFIASRGCPFDCSFCFNHSLKALYAGKGSYVRHRSVGNVIEEIARVKAKWKWLKTPYFADDSFLLNRKWTQEFCELYRKEIGMPFLCQIRADLLDEELAETIKAGGCHLVSLGVESGNDFLREKVLGKKITREQIERAASILRKHKILFRTYNMLCLPGETLDMAMETVTLNSKIKVDCPWASIVQPYPRTQLGEYVVEHGFVGPDFDPTKMSASFFKGSVFDLPEKREIENLQKLFYAAIKWHIPPSLVKRLVRLPKNPLFEAIFQATYLFNTAKAYRMPLWFTAWLGFQMRKLYTEN
ncbi:MAG: B12-binding domain-containing radical SAM protein [Candidatus Coatesbacteria bacterium]|nr:B12-binding domain-containing radical SAM protein [Candidatus Coatesbacteria bacterium]